MLFLRATALKRQIFPIIYGLLLLVALPSAFAQTDLAEIEAMIRQGEAQKAYELLAPEQFERAGDPAYDYLLGLSALESGRPNLATLAFERVLAVNPNMLGARLDMARAYVQLGNYDLARSEFHELQTMNPPPAAKKAIEAHLEALDSPQSTLATAGQSNSSAYAEFTLGHDSNVNSAAGSSDLFVPIFGVTVTLDSNSVALSDSYAQLAIGGQARHQINTDLIAFGSANLKIRAHDSEGSYNTKQGSVSGGLQKSHGSHSFTGALSYTSAGLDGNDYRDVWGLIGEWSYKINDQSRVSAFAAHNQIRYKTDAAEIYDSDMDLLGLSYKKQLGKDTLVSLGAYAGYDKSQGDRIDGSRNIAGIKLTAEHKLTDNHTVYGSLGTQRHNYKRFNVLFQEKRKDDLNEAVLGLDWQYARHWNIKPQLSYTENKSNIDLNTYYRTEVGLTIRRTLH